MKKKMTLIALLFSLTGISQSIAYLDFNNVSTLCSNSSAYFVNQGSTAPAYSVPSNENKNTIYSSSMWITAKNELDQLVGSATLYGGGEYDFFPGPIADDYNSADYDDYANQLWIVTKSEIETHQLEFNNPGYIVPSSILDWPGNGNNSIGISEQLAPYVDLNNNGIYEPESGDYPCVKGDKAIYSIMNDENGNRNVTSLDSMRIEMHIMFYQYATSDFLNNTTFFEVSMFNRSSQTYTDVKLGSFTDFDIGGAMDDLIGSDSTRSLIYAYNSDLNDENGFGSIGYAGDVPACGIKLLDQTASSIVGFESNSGFNVPTTTAEYSYFLNGLRPDGSPQINPNGAPTSFTHNAENSSGFTAVNLAIQGQDVQGVLNSTHNNFTPNSKITATYAVLFYRDSVENIFDAVDGLIELADSVQAFHDSTVINCGVLSVENLTQVEFSIFPNPMQDHFTIQSEGEFSYYLTDIQGKMIKNKMKVQFSSVCQIDHLTKGIYIVHIEKEGQTNNKKIIVH